jgi:lysozyme
MQMSQEGIDALLKKYEGCKLKAYRCPANVCTIGYGHTSAAGNPVVTDGMTITQKQCDDILRSDLVKYETSVHNMVTQPLTQHQFDVLVDFAYNAGIGNLKSSTLIKKVNAAKFDEVPAELMKWTKGGGKVLPGLVKRRQAESAWWMAHEITPTAMLVGVSKPTDAPTDDEHEQRTEPDAVPVPTMAASSQGNAAIITAGLGGLGAAKQVAANAQDASDLADQIMGLLGNTNFLIMLAVAGLGGAIWWFRKQHMEEHGV